LKKSVLKIEEAIHDEVGILFDADTRTQERIDRLDEKISNQLGCIEA
jgi:hypothetical protein